MQTVHLTSTPPQQGRPSPTYRPEIDGLRALAVLPVILYHAKLGFPGGYTGVDVFFTISGFLITSLILKDIESGKFSLAGFWERRIRRIFPALITMVLLSLLAGAFFLLPSDFLNLGKSAIAQAMLAANFYFWGDDSERGGYFGPTSNERPLLHTWSLAVEEQFYLFFPLIMLGLIRCKPFRNPRTLSATMLFGLLAGLAVSALGVKLRAGAAFYLLPTRAWELLCGALIATSFKAKLTPGNPAIRESLSWLGIAGIMLPYWLYTKETPFPGFAALPSCLGTGLVIWSNGRLDDRQTGLTSAGRLLTLPPLVFVGMISYSLYLWHWPVLVFGKYWLPNNQDQTAATIGLLLIGIFLSVLSWRFVETPFRTRQVMPTRQAAYRFAAAGTLLSLALSLLIVASHGLTQRMPKSVAQNDRARYDHLSWNKENQLETRDIQQGRITPLGPKTPTAPAKLLIWGDSHALHAIPAIDTLCRETGIKGYAVMYPSTPPLFQSTTSQSRYGLRENITEWATEVLQQIKQQGITHVVLAAKWDNYQAMDAQLLGKSLTATIHTLHNAGCKVWVLMDVPDVAPNPPYKVLARNTLFHTEIDRYCQTAKAHRQRNSVIYQLANQNLPATFLDPTPPLLSPDKDRYKIDINGISIYSDTNHLTKSASLALLLPMLQKEMSPLLRQP
ncbi:MAG: acyltransferase family protein [Chthoniobacteraceae bacterium]|nr:acyltransferase family protein [Chthoniobacteraceae bacterium]